MKSKFVSEGLTRSVSEVRRYILAGSLVCEVELSAQEQGEVVVRCHVDYPYTTEYAFEDSFSEARILKYCLAPSAAWLGVIERGRVVVRPSGADPNEVKILAPANCFRREGNEWVWNFANLEPTAADDIRVQAVAGDAQYPDRLITGKFADLSVDDRDRDRKLPLIERNKTWWVVHSHFMVNADSTVALAGKHRIEDRVPATRRNGQFPRSEWLELTPKKPQILRAIRIGDRIGLFTPPSPLYARPQGIEVVLNEEYRFEAILRDSELEQVVMVPDYLQPVKVVRIILKDVYPGRQYENACIEGISLETPVPKKPKLEDVPPGM